MIHLRHTFDMFVGIEKVIIAGVSKTLMPESFCLRLNCRHWSVLLCVYVEWQAMHVHRQIFRVFTELRVLVLYCLDSGLLAIC